MALRKETTRRFALLGGSVLGSLLVIEVLLRVTPLFGGVGLATLIADEYRILFGSMEGPGWTCQLNMTHLQPGCTSTLTKSQAPVPRWDVSINSDGFRDREYSVMKKQGVYRLLVLGDSYTFGEGVDNEETYAHLLEAKLRNRIDGVEFEVLNLGIPGAGMDDLSARLSYYIQYDPDLIIVQRLGNQAHRCKGFWDRMLDELSEGTSPLLAQAWEADLSREEIVALAREARNQPETFSRDLFFFVADYHLVYGAEERCACVRSEFETLLDLAKGPGAQVVLYDLVTQSSSCLGEDYASLRPEESPGFAYVSGGETLALRRYQLSRLDAHPNAAGHRVMAEELFPVVADMTRSSLGVLGQDSLAEGKA